MLHVLPLVSWRNSVATHGTLHAWRTLPWRHSLLSLHNTLVTPKVHDVDSDLVGIGHCQPVFGGTEVRSSFCWCLPVPNSTCCHSCWFILLASQPCTCSAGKGRGLERQRETDGRTQLACDSLCEEEYSLVRCTFGLVHACLVKPHTGPYFGLHRQCRHPACEIRTSSEKITCLIVREQGSSAGLGAFGVSRGFYPV